MPVTRSQTFFPRGPGRGGRDRVDRGRGGRGPGRAPLPPALPISGYAGLHYDTRQLSPISAERAAEGIEASFILHDLKNLTDGRDRYIAFQLYIPVAIRLYDPVTQRLQPVRATCNCADYQNTQSACAHLYWLFTRLNAVLNEDRQGNRQETRNQESTQVEVISGLSALYPLIEQRRDTLPRDLNDELESDSDESIIEDIGHNNTRNYEPANAYEPSLSSAETPNWDNGY